MPVNPPSVRYKLTAAIQAVKLEPHPGSSLPDPTGTLMTIPAESVIEVQGRTSASGLANIVWNGQTFSVFFEDLRDRACPMNSRV